MGRITAAWAVGMVVIVAAFTPGVAGAAQDGGDGQAASSRQAYKPAQRRQQTRAAEAAPAVPAGISDPEAYQKELDAAKEQRDRDLKAAAGETDRAKFERRKEEIFARYAAIISEMRDKYAAHQAETGDASQLQPKPGKTSRPGAVRPPGTATGKKRAPKDEEASPPVAARPTAKSKRAAKARGDAAGTLADARKRLDEENARHAAAMEPLNKQLADAKSSKNQREIRKAERAIEKENTTYEAKKALLESRVKELGGTVGSPARPVR